MALAFKCDRCGKLSTPYICKEGYKEPSRTSCVAKRVYDVLGNKTPASAEIDLFVLCEDCDSELKEWLHINDVAEDVEENEDDRSEEESGDDTPVETE